MVSAALRTGHCPRVKNIFQISLAHKHIVKKMSLFGPKMHPGCFQAIFLLDDCTRNGVLALGTELVHVAPIVIAVTNAMPTKDSFPGQ